MTKLQSWITRSGIAAPPKETQFKQGQSGNSKGRKRKPKSVQAQMQDVLARKIPISEGGQTKRLPLQQVILRNLANKAAKGDLKAVAFVLNLLISPEHADTNTIDHGSLSPEDQAMFDRMLSELMGRDSSDPSASEDDTDAQGAASAPPADAEGNQRMPRAPEGEEGIDDE